MAVGFSACQSLHSPRTRVAAGSAVQRQGHSAPLASQLGGGTVGEFSSWLCYPLFFQPDVASESCQGAEGCSHARNARENVQPQITLSVPGWLSLRNLFASLPTAQGTAYFQKHGIRQAVL